MPWEEKVIVTMREEFVKRVLSHEKSKAELCREYGISRPTGDKWIERYLNGQPLCDQSRAPHIVGNKTDDEVEKFIVDGANSIIFSFFNNAKHNRNLR